MTQLYTNNDLKRIIDNDEVEFRSPFRRDNGRLIHSSIFRRLQGKTQLFPNYESDFFRNRLTHSIEVAQIAKGIAEYLNFKDDYFKNCKIDIDLVETAAFAHDLGHPPFGHNGEKALDDMMKCYGGFEGNAQTLRILSKLEKKYTLDGDYIPVKNGKDMRRGLNLCFRTLASVLKYDYEIPMHRKKNDRLIKGYYYTESDIVKEIKKNVLGKHCSKKLKTIECQIMDIADDISYSTYDLEDAFKAEFLSPLGILSSEPQLISKVAKNVSEYLKDDSVDDQIVSNILAKTYELFDETVLRDLNDLLKIEPESHLLETYKHIEPSALYSSTYAYDLSKNTCINGYLRTKHTSSLVNQFILGIQVDTIDDETPSLSKISLIPEIRKQVEVLKRYTYCAMIESPKLKIAEFRGYDIVKEIFETLASDSRKGYMLLPEDFRKLYNEFSDEALKKRVICDFISGMTDKYAVEFYARINSENPQTIFKPF